MALANVKLGEEIADRRADHRWAVVGVQREAMPIHAMHGHSVIDQGFCYIAAFTLGKRPSNDVTAEDVHDHVQLEVHPFLWAEQLGDVPTPNLIGSRRAKLGFDPCRMRRLAPAFAHLTT